ncbi:hypothetical protein Tco_1476963 [Tanacetum coccineum]
MTMDCPNLALWPVGGGVWEGFVKVGDWSVAQVESDGRQNRVLAVLWVLAGKIGKGIYKFGVVTEGREDD